MVDRKKIVQLLTFRKHGVLAIVETIELQLPLNSYHVVHTGIMNAPRHGEFFRGICLVHWQLFLADSSLTF